MGAFDSILFAHVLEHMTARDGLKRGFGVEEWNLEPKDQRCPSPQAPGIDSFVFAYADRAPEGGASP